MKKTIISAVLFAIFSFVTLPAFSLADSSLPAQGTPAYIALVQTLEAEIVALTKQLQILIAARISSLQNVNNTSTSNTVTVTTPPATPPATPQAQIGTAPSALSYCFTVNLNIGSSGSDVVALQNFLISNGINPGYVSGYFDTNLFQALAAYQTGVDAHYGKSLLTDGAGYFGPITSSYVNPLVTNCNHQPITSSAVIATPPPAPVVNISTAPSIAPLTASIVSPSSSTITASTGITFSATASGGSGSYTYAWDFGDGSVSQTGYPYPNISHGYTTVGTFTVKLTATDSAGRTASGGSVTITVSSAQTTQPPVITSFYSGGVQNSIIQTSSSPGAVSSITGTNLAGVTTVNFGSQPIQVTAVKSNSSFFFTTPAGLTPGTYPLSVYGPGGVSNTITITVNAPAQKRVPVTAFPTSIPSGGTVTFSYTPQVGETNTRLTLSGPAGVSISNGAQATTFPASFVITNTSLFSAPISATLNETDPNGANVVNTQQLVTVSPASPQASAFDSSANIASVVNTLQIIIKGLQGLIP